MLYSFGTLTWRGAGIDDVTISALWAESVAIEIVLMLFGGWLLAQLGVCGLIGLGLAAGLVRWTGMAFTTELWALVLLQALHSCTFAACHLGAMAFLQRALPTHGAAIGQSLYYALGTGATQAVVYQFSGLLYSEYGQHAFLGMTVVSALGHVRLLLLARTWTRRVAWWDSRNRHSAKGPYCSSRDLLQPVDGLAIETLLQCDCVIAVSALAPCQCFTPGGIQTTSPGLISCRPRPSAAPSPCPPSRSGSGRADGRARHCARRARR